MPTMTYLQAISDGLREEMRDDERVFCMGEDIGVFGGAFKVTLGFQEEFGPDRVMDTPLAESGIVGTAVGAAVVGLRPVCEMQFSDFISCGFDQLVNVAGKMHYRQGLAVPITVRLPTGGGFSGGPFHSQNPESSFAHIPGLKVLCPATPEDAKGLLVSAIGRIPTTAAPMAVPMIPDSASGVSITRSGPNSSMKPSVTLKAPPKVPMSSPITNTRSSERISSRIASAIACR